MVVQRWRRDALNASAEKPATIRTNSRTEHHDEATNLSLLKKIIVKTIPIRKTYIFFSKTDKTQSVFLSKTTNNEKNIPLSPFNGSRKYVLFRQHNNR